MRSICNKLVDFEFFMTSYKPDVFCVTETWLHHDMPDSLLCPSGYSVVRYDRNTKGGGVALFIHNYFEFNRVAVAPEFDKTEIVCIDLTPLE